ncbi:hypothetical protein BDZ91DRAFT_769072 [Kalaharituber pfeilii]|nr:hypothetical protein BDZ91DRAFT_769072 [Kalaharituber pfeilii]
MQSSQLSKYSHYSFRKKYWEWIIPAIVITKLETNFKQAIDQEKYTLGEEGSDDQCTAADRQRQGGSILPLLSESSLGGLDRQCASSFVGEGLLPPPTRSQKKSGAGSSLSSSNSEEEEKGKKRKKKRKRKKHTTSELMEEFFAQFLKIMPKQKETSETLKLQPYKGDPEDLEQFLWQLENV